MNEWLETNKAGGFSSSTTIERNDRKYHGLLLCPVKGHEGRYHFLSAVDAAMLDGSGLTLGTNSYPDAVYPESYHLIEKNELLPWPLWIYSLNGTKVQKEIFMREGESAVWIVFTMQEGPETADMDLKFLFTFRNSNELTKANEAIDKNIRLKKNGFVIQPYAGLPEAEVTFSGNWKAEVGLYWDYNVCYEMEKERGHEWIEDRFVPGKVTVELNKNNPFVIRVGINEDGVGKNNDAEKTSLTELYRKEKKARAEQAKNIDSPFEVLKFQSRHFLLKNPSGKKSINAGYPWFGEWGRDTMIALPGLTFYNGDTAGGIKILSDYISMIKDGLLPNTLGETQGFTSYNSIDAGLLFCWAIGKLLNTGYGSLKPEKKVLTDIFLPAVSAIVTAFLENRVPDARLDKTGLIDTGSINTQLTWMDATAWGKPVTPRYGFAVDLNALWYDALSLLVKLSSGAGVEPGDEVKRLIEIIPGIFKKVFWLEDEQYLSDTVNEHGPDKKIRPNMLFASSASPGLLSMEMRRAVVKCAEAYLLTPLGLRTLAPDDPDFSGMYEGGPDQRDSVYHQGTVWAWLIGIMVESSLITAEDIEQKAKFWSDYISHLLDKHLYREGWGFISEVFDGLNPGKGKGSFAQAWSCSEIIRAAELVRRIEK